VGEPLWGRGQIADTWFEETYPHLELEPGVPRMPRGAAELLRRCLQQRPKVRPRDMLTVANTLRGIYEQTTGRAYQRTEGQPAELLADSLNNRAVSLLDLGRPEEAERTWDLRPTRTTRRRPITRECSVGDKAG
jgi:hypothetical protein